MSLAKAAESRKFLTMRRLRQPGPLRPSGPPDAVQPFESGIKTLTYTDPAGWIYTYPPRAKALKGVASRARRPGPSSSCCQ